MKTKTIERMHLAFNNAVDAGIHLAKSLKSEVGFDKQINNLSIMLNTRSEEFIDWLPIHKISIACDLASKGYTIDEIKHKIMESKKPKREFYLRVDDEEIRVNEPQTWTTTTGGDPSYSISFESGMSKKEFNKIKKETKRQQKQFDKFWEPVVEYESIYEFNHDHKGLKPGVPFIMNNQLFEVIETEGTKIRAKKIMKTKKHKVEIPEGYEVIDTVSGNDVDGKIFTSVIMKPIKKELPKTWEEYCEAIKPPAWLNKYLTSNNDVPEKYKALGRLELLRDVYNDGWVPNWNNLCMDKYCIFNRAGTIMDVVEGAIYHMLAFKSEKLRDEFLANFESLIIEAKPLL